MSRVILTSTDLLEGFAQLGVASGTHILVHASLSSFGAIHGGAQTLIESILQTVTPKGGVVMPAFNAGRFDPSEWGNPPVSADQWERLRFDTPLFDSQKTPTDESMSCVYELFRTWPDVRRSGHPHSSFAAWGAQRETILATHQLDDRLGETSPLAYLYELDAKVLFLGSGYDTNTCFHLGEYRVTAPPSREFMIVQLHEGLKKLHHYNDVDTNSSVFAEIGEAFEQVEEVRFGQIGQAQCRLFSLRKAVDFAQRWLEEQSGIKS